MYTKSYLCIALEVKEERKNTIRQSKSVLGVFFVGGVKKALAFISSKIEIHEIIILRHCCAPVFGKMEKLNVYGGGCKVSRN